MTFEIQKGVEKPRLIRSTPLQRKRRYPFEEMDIGDMFFVPNRERNTLCTHASAVGRELGRKFHTRLMYMQDVGGYWRPCEAEDNGATKGIGVWRDA